MLIGIVIGLVIGAVLGFLLGAGLSVILDDEYRPTAPVMYGYGGADAGEAWRMRVPARPEDADFYPRSCYADEGERARIALHEELRTDEHGDWIDDENLRIWDPLRRKRQ